MWAKDLLGSLNEQYVEFSSSRQSNCNSQQIQQEPLCYVLVQNFTGKGNNLVHYLTLFFGQAQEIDFFLCLYTFEEYLEATLKSSITGQDESLIISVPGKFYLRHTGTVSPWPLVWNAFQSLQPGYHHFWGWVVLPPHSLLLPQKGDKVKVFLDITIS